MGLAEILWQKYSYIAMVVILFLDSIGVPWPTEATLVAAGSASGSLVSVVLAWVGALAGAAMGSSLSYYLGRRMGPTLIGRIVAFFRLSPQTATKVDEWFEHHGHRAVFFGRMIPFVRNLTGYPAGVMGMPFGKYMAFSLAGYGLYIAFALSLGFGGKAVARWVGDIEIFLAVLIPLAALVLWFKYGRKWVAQRRGKG